jgi:thiol:disulfide interchange protein
MNRILFLVASLVTSVAVSSIAQAADVFVTKDAQGRPIYTDRPDALPAQKVNITTKKTDTVEAQRAYDEKMKAYSATEKAEAKSSQQAAEAKQAKELTATDKAKRCQDARANYQDMMNARRLYEPGATEGERRYLDSNEIDEARANAKQLMDQFCAGQ